MSTRSATAAIALVILSLSSSASRAADFAFEFEWGNIPLCTTGNASSVVSPRFKLENVPPGTKFIEFQMTDLDNPQFNHGGGTVQYDGGQVIEPGAFQYYSPCPRRGPNTYEWTAYAKESDGFFSGSISNATARRQYP